MLFSAAIFQGGWLSRNRKLIQTWEIDRGNIVRTIIPCSLENHHVSLTGKWIPLLQENYALWSVITVDKEFYRSTDDSLAEIFWGR